MIYIIRRKWSGHESSFPVSANSKEEAYLEYCKDLGDFTDTDDEPFDDDDLDITADEEEEDDL